MKTKTQRDRLRSNRLRSRFLKFEPLEERTVLDGNVSAFVSNGTLHIKGDGSSNEITIEQFASRTFTVSSRDGSTTINGQAGPLTFTRVGKDLDISMNGGDDVVELTADPGDPFWVVNKLSIKTGNGDDQVLMTQVRTLRLSVDTGSGNDTVNIGDNGNSGGIMVTKEAFISTGGGTDDLQIANSLFKRTLVANLGAGADTAEVQSTTFRKTSVVDGGANADSASKQGNRGKLKLLSFSSVSNTVDNTGSTPEVTNPTANNDTATVARSASTTINLASNDTPSTGSTLNLASIVITQQPASGTVTVNSNGTVTYTNNGASATTDSFKYTIKDQTGSVSSAATVAISVTSAFTAIADTATVTEDASPNTATGNVLTNEVNAAGTKTVSAVNGAAGSVGTSVNGQFGTFVINADGTYTYTLNNSNTTVNALSTGQTLTDTMNYTASDGTTTSTTSLTVTIQGHTDTAFNAVDDTGSVTEDSATTTATGNVLTNETNVAGNKTVTAVNNAAGSVGASVNGQFGTFQVNTDGTFTYTLNNSNTTVNALSNGQTLTDSMTYTASDGTTTSSATLRITIQGHTDSNFSAINDTATATEDASPNTTTGNVLTNDTDPVGTKTVSAVAGVAGNVGTNVNGQFGTFRINADGSFIYTLDNANATVNNLATGQTLSDTVNYTASDGTTTATATLTITIQGHTDTAFNAVNDTGSVTEDSSTTTSTGNVLTNDANAAGTKTVTAVSGTAGSVGTSVNGQFGTFQINSDGTFTYTLNNSNATVNALNNGQTLTDSINYTASDGTTTSTASLAITIQGHTEAAFAAVNDAATITEDANPNTSTGNVLTNDTNPVGNKTVTAVAGAAGNLGTVLNGAHGTFQINADGTFTYTLNNASPTVNALTTGQTLTDTINYTASDGTTTASATLTVTIQGHTDTAFNPVDDTGSVTEDSSNTTSTGNVLTNDTNAVGTTTVTVVNGSASNVGTTISGQFGTFLINADGTYTYTLDNTKTAVNALADGQTLTDSMSYTASDGTTTASATLRITIQGHTDPVFAAANDAATVVEDATPNTSTGNVLTNDANATGTKTVTAISGTAANVGAVVNGVHGTFQINADGTFTYTLNNASVSVNDLDNGESLTDTITYTASDGTTTSTATLTVTIQGHTDTAFNAIDDTAAVTEDSATDTATGNVLTNDLNAASTKTVTAVNGATGSVGVTIPGQYGTFRINADGTFTYTLDNTNSTVNALGSSETLDDSMSYTATDGTTTTSATLKVTIQGHTDTTPAFAAAADTGTVTEDSATTTATGNVLTNDANAAGTKSVTQVNNAAGSVGTVVQGQYGTFQINSDGSYTYTLDNTNADVNALATGASLQDAMSYTATDGTTTSSATLTITIEGHTDAAPAFAAAADTGTVTEDSATTTATGNVLTNDANAAGTKSVTQVNNAAGSVGTVVQGQYGTFQINSDGSYTYTLDNTNADVNALATGASLQDAMSYTATDGTTTSSATLTITIEGHTDPVFTAVNDTGDINEDDATDLINGNVLANDTDATGTKTVTAVNGAAANVGTTVTGQFGTFVLNADGSFTYTIDNTNTDVNALNDGNTLTDTLTYTAEDDNTSSTATLTITIHGHTD